MGQAAGVTTGSGDVKPPNSDEKRGFFARIALFFRQVIDQMSKVVWPSRKELFGYFVAVLFFVAAVMTYVGVLDLGFANLMLLIFG